MQVFTNIGGWIKLSSKALFQPISTNFGDALERGGPEAMLEGLLTLVVVDEEHNPGLRTILQLAVHGQTRRDIVTLLNVNWNSVIVQRILTDNIGLASCHEHLLPLNFDSFCLRL